MLTVEQACTCLKGASKTAIRKWAKKSPPTPLAQEQELHCPQGGVFFNEKESHKTWRG